jgi:hypothetical protein
MQTQTMTNREMAFRGNCAEFSHHRDGLGGVSAPMDEVEGASTVRKLALPWEPVTSYFCFLKQPELLD